MKYASKIYEFYNSSKSRLFIIPLYQRTYEWEQINCKRLFDDLIKVNNKHLLNHFFGSIVSINNNNTDDDLLIIDGQQRITTISLIILALKNASLNNDIKFDNIDIVIDRTNDYLFAKYKKTDRKIRLKPIEKDIVAYDILFNNDPSEFIDSGITRNYNFFYEQIVKSGLSFDEIMDAIEKLSIIDLRLDPDDNPQLIFESLNSTGKDLAEADKIRNYMLMSLSKQQQEEFYHKYWIKIEQNTDDNADQLTMFIRDYLTIHLKKICNIDNLYFDFKEYDEEYNNLSGDFLVDRENFFKKLLAFSNLYRKISKGQTGINKIDKKLKQIASIGSSVGMPFYMSFFYYAESQKLDEHEIYNVLDITENFWARRIICGYPANTLQKLYATLHFDVLKIYELHQKRNIPVNVSYSEIMKYILLKKQGIAAFPNDTEIDEYFMKRQVYKLPIDYRYFLFERLENENSNEGLIDIVKGMKEGSITIEHIMPQTLTSEWQQSLGENWEEIHEKYLHTFANLTLTGYNANYSNRTFHEKKYGYKDKKGNQIYGFIDSGYRLSNFLKTCDEWNEEKIIERGNLLHEKFLALWPMITTKYEPLEKEVDTVSLADDEYELSYRDIVAFTYKGTKYNVLNWKEMLVKLSQIVYNENKSSVIFLCNKNNWYHDHESSEFSKIIDNYYVYTSCSTKTKRSIIQFLFANCNISETELEFHLKPISKKE